MSVFENVYLSYAQDQNTLSEYLKVICIEKSNCTKLVIISGIYNIAVKSSTFTQHKTIKGNTAFLSRVVFVPIYEIGFT